jgi:hypothetical protein
MNHSAKSLYKILVSITAPALLVAFFIEPSAAQRSRNSRAERAAAKAIEFEQYQREMRLRNLGEQNKQPTEKEQRLALAQIKEDFERMQVVNNQMMRAVATGDSLDYKLVSESLEEINRRAKRLKENLRMQDVEAKEGGGDKVAGVADVKASLSTLDDFIMSFVQSPLFQNPKLIDADQRAKAGSDLENIIGLSRDTKKLLVRVVPAH